MGKFYAVRIGKEGPKIYSDWESCKQQVLGYSGAVYKSFPTLFEAQNFISESSTQATALSVSTDPSDTNSQTIGLYPYQFLRIQENFDTQQLPTISGNQSFLDKIFQITPICMYTDGSASPVTQKAGAGIYFPQINFGLSVNVPGNQTNNRGEFWSVIYGLEYVQAHFRAANLPPVEIIVYSDSELTINVFVNTAVKNLDLVALIQQQKKFYPFRFVKVLAHSGDINNDRADVLAKMSAGL